MDCLTYDLSGCKEERNLPVTAVTPLIFRVNLADVTGQG